MATTHILQFPGACNCWNLSRLEVIGRRLLLYMIRLRRSLASRLEQGEYGSLVGKAERISNNIGQVGAWSMIRAGHMYIDLIKAVIHVSFLSWCPNWHCSSLVHRN